MTPRPAVKARIVLEMLRPGNVENKHSVTQWNGLSVAVAA